MTRVIIAILWAAMILVLGSRLVSGDYALLVFCAALTVPFVVVFLAVRRWRHA